MDIKSNTKNFVGEMIRFCVDDQQHVGFIYKLKDEKTSVLGKCAFDLTDGTYTNLPNDTYFEVIGILNKITVYVRNGNTGIYKTFDFTEKTT